MIVGANATNAFAEADGPEQMYYIRPDDAFRNWWVKELKREPIAAHYVILIMQNMQGHPEAARLWSRHVHKILTEKLKMNATTHEPCIYSGLYKNTKIYMIRQVNNFAILAPNVQIAQQVLEDLGEYLIEPLKMQGVGLLQQC